MITIKKLRTFEQKHLDIVLKSKDVYRIKQFLEEWGLCIKDKKIRPKDEYAILWEELYGYYDKRQNTLKLKLNSLYGALLNPGSRFSDQRLGQSTTLTGRTITRHMGSQTNLVVAGEYNHYGEACIYNDTDSVFFSAYPILKSEIEKGKLEWTKESIINLYNDIAKGVSDTFPDFLLKKLNVPKSRSTGVIASSRETVSESAIWITKKRYACLMFDKDGIRLDTDGKPGKVKAMGLDLRRSDTPKFVQKFLSDILLDTLTDKGEHYVIQKIKAFKEQFEDMKPWQQGSPKAVNRLTYYREKEELHMMKKMKNEVTGGVTMPGHVRASIAWNRLKEMNNDMQTMKILDGQKVIVCKLKTTSENTLTSIAFPTDENRLPQWFTSLPFASDEMMAAVVDKKVKNLLGTLGWDLSRTKAEHAQFESLFDLSGF